MQPTHISNPHFRPTFPTFDCSIWNKTFRFTQMNITEHSSYESRSVFRQVGSVHNRLPPFIFGRYQFQQKHWVKGDRVNPHPVRVPSKMGWMARYNSVCGWTLTELPWLSYHGCHLGNHSVRSRSYYILDR